MSTYPTSFNVADVNNQPEVDRRGKPRIAHPFPAFVKGTDTAGEDFDIEAAVDNLSASGLYLRIPRQVHLGTMLAIQIKMIIPGSEKTKGINVAAQAEVLRIERLANDSFGVAVHIIRQRVV